MTGASKGIGAEIAKHLADEGASVVVNYATSKAAAEKVVSEIASRGGKAVAVQADVAKPEDIRRLFAESKHSEGLTSWSTTPVSTTSRSTRSRSNTITSSST